MRVFASFSRQDGDSAGVIFCGTRQNENLFFLLLSLARGFLAFARNDMGMTEGTGNVLGRFLVASLARNNRGMTILKLRI